MENEVFKLRGIFPGLFSFTWTFESFFRKPLLRKGSYLVALGNPLDDTVVAGGALRYYPIDQNWQAIALELFDISSTILVHPGNSENLKWELNQISQNPEWLNKLFLLAPPKQSRFILALRSFENFLRNIPQTPWDRVVRGFESAGLSLPALCPGVGSIIRFNHKGAGCIVAVDCCGANDYLKVFQDGEISIVETSYDNNYSHSTNNRPFRLAMLVYIAIASIFFVSVVIYYDSGLYPDFTNYNSTFTKTRNSEQSPAPSHDSIATIQGAITVEPEAIDSIVSDYTVEYLNDDVINQHLNNNPLISSNVIDFVPKGYLVLDSLLGDLNRDKFIDAILILKRIEENEGRDDLLRPLMLFAGLYGQKFQLVAINSDIVLCKGCGGTIIDPYKKTVIRNGYFSIEHLILGTPSMSRIITFKFIKNKRTFYLSRDAGVVYDSASHSEIDYKINEGDFLHVTFDEYKNEIKSIQ